MNSQGLCWLTCEVLQTSNVISFFVEELFQNEFNITSSEKATLWACNNVYEHVQIILGNHYQYMTSYNQL